MVCSITMKNSNKTGAGFTLLELLIVIAIIGILASVVLLRYPMTVKRVKDSRIMTDLVQFRSKAHVLFDNSGNYGQVKCEEDCSCPDNTLKILCQDGWDNSDETIKVRVNNDGSGFCAVGHLQDYEQYFCVDSTLRAKRYDISPAAPGGKCFTNCENKNKCACQ